MKFAGNLVIGLLLTAGLVAYYLMRQQAFSESVLVGMRNVVGDMELSDEERGEVVRLIEELHEDVFAPAVEKGRADGRKFDAVFYYDEIMRVVENQLRAAGDDPLANKLAAEQERYRLTVGEH